MDERRDPAPPADSRPPLIAANAKLTATQRTWDAYSGHVLRCTACRSIRDLDAEPCATAGQLHQAWEAAAEDARRQMLGVPARAANEGRPQA